MGINYFTEEQVKQLMMNPYVKKVGEKSITYTEEFKELFMTKYRQGIPPSEILKDLQFDVSALGESRISNLTDCIKKQSKRVDGFEDTRKTNAGIPSTKDLSTEEIILRQQDEIEYLKQKGDFLSDLRRLEREAMWKESKSRKKKNSK